MGRLEQDIRDFARKEGVALAGIAGPDRLDGPPSLSPGRVLPGGRSLVSLVLPMDVPAIHDFLSKKSPAPHNVDQNRENQRLMRIGSRMADFLRVRGFAARAVPGNGNYRRSPDPWSMHPVFSHRLAALASGVGGQGWSGNVKTEEFGAAVYLGTVVTDTGLTSDPLRFGPRHFTDNDCARCRLCARSCVARMFSAGEEEYVLQNGRLHPRGKRGGVDLCEISCFGLHSLSPDKKWTTWGVHWIPEWLDLDPGKLSPLQARRWLMQKSAQVGDSAARFDLIRRIGSIRYPIEVIDRYLSRHPETKPQPERVELLRQFARDLGSADPGAFWNDHVLTCGNCALICGPNAKETARRHKMLVNSGFVVPGPGGVTRVVKTYGEARALREEYMPRISLARKLLDGAHAGYLFQRHYFGVEPRSLLQGARYARKLARAAREKAPGHSENPA